MESIFTLRNAYSDENDPPKVFADNLKYKSTQEIYDFFDNKRFDYLKTNYQEKITDFVQTSLLFYMDLDNNHDRTDSKEPLSFFINIIISNNASDLNKIYNSYINHPLEILLLIENNFGDYSSASYFIKRGTEISKTISKETIEKFNIFLESNQKQLKDQFGDDILKKLLALPDGMHKGKNLIEKFQFLLMVASFPLKLLPSGMINICELLIKGINYITIKPESWDPTKATGDYFIPIFFPGFKVPISKKAKQKSKKYINNLNSDNEKQSEIYLAFDAIKTLIEQQKQLVINDVDTFYGVNYEGIISSLALEDTVVDKTLILLKSTITDMQIFVLDVFKAFLNIVEKSSQYGVVFMNAVIAGFLNSVLQLLALLVNIIKLQFVIVLKVIELGTNLEAIDELIVVAQELNFKVFLIEIGKLFSKVWDKLASITINDLIKALNLSPAQIGYLTGGLLEFILEIVIGIIYTGGTLTVLGIGKELLAIFKGLIAIIKTIVKKFFKIAEKVTIEVGQFIIRLLSKSKDELEKLFKEIWEAIRDWFDKAVDATKNSQKLLDDVKSNKTPLDELADGTKAKKGNYIRASNFAELVTSDYIRGLKTWSNGKPVKFVNLIEDAKSLDDPIRKGIDGIFETNYINTHRHHQNI